MIAKLIEHAFSGGHGIAIVKRRGAQDSAVETGRESTRARNKLENEKSRLKGGFFTRHSEDFCEAY
jgi:hypothetical protein